jgi:hypothetical protein
MGEESANATQGSENSRLANLEPDYSHLNRGTEGVRNKKTGKHKSGGGARCVWESGCWDSLHCAHQAATKKF